MRVFNCSLRCFGLFSFYYVSVDFSSRFWITCSNIFFIWITANLSKWWWKKSKNRILKKCVCKFITYLIVECKLKSNGNAMVILSMSILISRLSDDYLFASLMLCQKPKKKHSYTSTIFYGRWKMLNYLNSGNVRHNLQAVLRAFWTFVAMIDHSHIVGMISFIYT